VLFSIGTDSLDCWICGCRQAAKMLQKTNRLTNQQVY